MSQPSSSSQSEPFIGALKIFPLLFDASRLNAVVHLEDGTLKHLKIIDKKKFARLRPNSWFRIQGIDQENSSIVLNTNSNFSALRQAKPDISEASLEQARILLADAQPQVISVVKSPQISELRRVSVKGKVIRKGEVTPRTNSKDGSSFTVQNFRIADPSGTMRVAVFNKKDALSLNDFIVIHNAKKKFYKRRHLVEFDHKTSVEMEWNGNYYAIGKIF